MSDQQTNLLDDNLNEDIQQVEVTNDVPIVNDNINDTDTDNELDSTIDTSIENIEEDLVEPSEEDNSEESAVAIVDAQSPGVNCLYLTVKKDYNLSIIKNKIKRALKGSWRVAVSVFILNFLSSFL